MPSKFSKVSTSIEESATLIINEKIRALKNQGVEVFGFGMGELDFDTPQYIVDAAKDALDDPRNYRYSGSTGLEVLREAIAKKTSRTSGLNYEANNVVVTNGAKQSMANIFTMLCEEGDEILVPSPYWLSYKEVISLGHGKCIEIPSTLETDFKVSRAQLEEYYNPGKTKALVMVNPQNPTGTLMSPNELKEIADFVLEKDIWLIADEIYENFVYDNKEYSSILKVEPKLKDNTIILNGVAKSFAMTGFRVGWAVAPIDAIEVMQNIQSQVVSNVFNVAQLAALRAIESEQEECGKAFLKKTRDALQNRRDIALQILSKTDNIKNNTPLGAFYFFVDISSCLREGETTMDFINELLETKAVVCVPGEGFGMSGHIRISYAVDERTVKEGISRLVEFADGRAAKIKSGQ